MWIPYLSNIMLKKTKTNAVCRIISHSKKSWPGSCYWGTFVCKNHSVLGVCTLVHWRYVQKDSSWICLYLATVCLVEVLQYTTCNSLKPHAISEAQNALVWLGQTHSMVSMELLWLISHCMWVICGHFCIELWGNNPILGEVSVGLITLHITGRICGCLWPWDTFQTRFKSWLKKKYEVLCTKLLNIVCYSQSGITDYHKDFNQNLSYSSSMDFV